MSEPHGEYQWAELDFRRGPEGEQDMGTDVPADEPRVTADDLRAACAGMLQLQLYAVFTKPVSGMKPVMEMLEKHLDYQISMEKRGILFAAGPFWTDDEQEWQGEGMVVIRAQNLAAARAIAAEDPMHSSGARTFEVRPWLINEGSLTVRLEHSTRSFTAI